MGRVLMYMFLVNMNAEVGPGGGGAIIWQPSFCHPSQLGFAVVLLTNSI
jgi:hypothetical protein